MKKEETSSFINLKLPQILRVALFCVAVAYLVIYLWMVYFRIRYPFDLEWIEGGMVNQVQRLIHGQAMYVAPAINYVPFLYPPVYFYSSALAALIFGIGFFPLRLVSFLASLVSFTTIFLIVRNETNNWWVALLSTGLFAATFRVTGAWLDVARVDSLFLALWLAFVYFVRGRKSAWLAMLTGLLAALAYLTKQTALIACLPILVYLFWCNWKFALICLGTAALTIGITTLVMNFASAGWYSYYVFGLLSQQTEWLPQEFITFWKDDLLVHLPLAILFAAFFFFGRPKQDRRNIFQWLSILTGALAGSFITRVKIGGYDNVLLPVYAVLSILFGLGLGGMLALMKQSQDDYKARLEVLIQTACLIQLAMILYNPFAQIPTKADLDAGNLLVKMLSQVKGTVFLPDQSYLPALAGKSTFANNSAIWDVLRGDQQTHGKALLSTDIRNTISRQSFDEIIVDADVDLGWCCAGIDQYYTRVGEVFQDPTVFNTLTGDKKRPTYIYVANRLK
ncbi:MAG: glycosyltransferase family 39 protein [Anaerolineales bacterium]|jgi:ABC-type multidrug transport system fused ATPase/permease subunit